MREGEKERKMGERERRKEGRRVEEGMVKDRHENNTIVSHLDGSRVLPSRGGRGSPSQTPAQNGGGGWPVLTLPQGHPHLHPHQQQGLQHHLLEDKGYLHLWFATMRYMRLSKLALLTSLLSLSLRQKSYLHVHEFSIQCTQYDHSNSLLTKFFLKNI